MTECTYLFLVILVLPKNLFSYFFRIRSASKMGKKGKKGLSKKPGERTIKSMANAVSSDEGEADGQDMVGEKARKPISQF